MKYMNIINEYTWFEILCCICIYTRSIIKTSTFYCNIMSCISIHDSVFPLGNTPRRKVLRKLNLLWISLIWLWYIDIYMFNYLFIIYSILMNTVINNLNDCIMIKSFWSIKCIYSIICNNAHLICRLLK